MNYENVFSYYLNQTDMQRKLLKFVCTNEEDNKYIFYGDYKLSLAIIMVIY